MDPEETWHLICHALKRLEQAISDGHEDADARIDAIFFLNALIRWLQQGGFPPTIE